MLLDAFGIKMVSESEVSTGTRQSQANTAVELNATLYCAMRRICRRDVGSRRQTLVRLTRSLQFLGVEIGIQSGIVVHLELPVCLVPLGPLFDLVK